MPSPFAFPYYAGRRAVAWTADRVLETAAALTLRASAIESVACRRFASHVVARIGAGAHTAKLLPRVDLVIIKGPEWSVAFIGDPCLYSQLKGLFVRDSATARPARRVSLWGLREAVDYALDHYPLVICSLPQGFPDRWRPKAPLTFRTPVFIDHALDLRIPLDVHLRGTARKTVRHLVAKVKQSRLAWRTTRDAAAFSRFYAESYVPFHAAKHGAEALIVPHDTLAARLARPEYEFLELVAGNEVVGGNLVSFRGRVARSHEFGLASHCPIEVARLLPTANFLGGIERAAQRGCHWYHFGASRAAWSDPVFRAKRRWGARTVPLGRLDHPEWTWLARDLPASLAASINNIGPVTFLDGRCYVVGVAPAHDPSPPAGTLDGADGWLVVRPGANEIVHAPARSAP